MDTAELAAKIPNQAPRLERRGSVLRREALERIRQGKSGPVQKEGGRFAEGGTGIPNDLGTQGVGKSEGLVQNRSDSRRVPAPTGGLGMAWGQKPHSAIKPRKHRGSSIRDGREGVGSPSTGGDARTLSGVDVNKGVANELKQRAKAMQERKTSRRRESVLRANDLEKTSVEKVEEAFAKFYVPPLGPLDDPPGVIYLDGKLTEKTVDVGVLNSVGEGVQAARKELFDLGSRRRSLVEESRAQTRRVSLGFPRDTAAESLHDERTLEVDSARAKAEGKLHRLLDHRRRLLDVLKASEIEDDRDVRASSKIVQSELPPPPVRTVRGADGSRGGGGGGDKKGSNTRRSSLDNLKELAKELMASEPAVNAGLASRTVVDAEGGTTSTSPVEEASNKEKMRRQLLDKGWREVMETVFSGGEGRQSRRVGSSGLRTGGNTGSGGHKGSNIWGFILATTAREHVDFLIAAMNPARAHDLPVAVECFLRHYTGPAADELDILLGGRVAATQIQCLLEMTLAALDTVHIRYVPSVLMLQWLLARAPHLRALLLKGGVLRRAFRRLEKAEKTGFGSAAEKAMQYGTLSLVIGISFS